MTPYHIYGNSDCGLLALDSHCGFSLHSAADLPLQLRERMKSFDVAVSELLVREDTQTPRCTVMCVSVVSEPSVTEGEMRGLLPVLL